MTPCPFRLSYFKEKVILMPLQMTWMFYFLYLIDFFSFITSRNEVVAKVMFLHVSVILSTGRVLRAGPPDQGEPLPRTRQTHPPDQADTLSGRENPPGPGRPPWDQADPPRTRQTPPRKKTAAYGR